MATDGGGGLLAAQPQPSPKQLTAAIKGCSTLDRLAQLYAEHAAALNPIHIAAIITKLPKLEAAAQQQAAAGAPPPGAAAAAGDQPWLLAQPGGAQPAQLRQLLQQLLAQLKAQGLGDHSPRGVANIVWALARVQCAPDAELLKMLLDQFCASLGAAVPQDVSNLLWGLAKLTKERSAVLDSSAEQPAAAPGSSSSSAGLMLQREQVKVLLACLCTTLPAASVQTISNSLWAVGVLQQEHAWCMCHCLPEVQALLTAFCEHRAQALPGHVQPVIRCMAALASSCSGHAGQAWTAWQPPLLARLLEHLSDSQRQQMELHHVSSVLRDATQVVCLQLLLAKQDNEGGRSTVLIDALGAPTPSSSTLSSSAASSSSSMAGPSSHGGSQAQQQQVQPAAAAPGDEGDELLARLAAAGGPQDLSSTVVALAMLQPHLQRLGLQATVAQLCSMLPASALPNLAPDVNRKLLAATSRAAGEAARDSAAATGGIAAAAGSPASSHSSGSGPDSPSLPASSILAASLFAQTATAGAASDAFTRVPLASPGSSSTSSTSSGSNVASPTHSELHLPAGSSNPGHGDAGGMGLQQQQQPLGSDPSVSQAPEQQQQQAGASAAAAAGPDSHEEAAARQLTHNIAYADSVFQLADIFMAHATVMDMIHITACITRLSKVLGSSPTPAAQAAAAALLPMLGAKLQAVLPHANARGIANVLWGYGRLRNLPQVELLPPLLEAFLRQLPNAACRDSAVVLWSLARLAEGQGSPQAVGVQPPLLRRLGRELLQHIAGAAKAPSSPAAAAAAAAASQAEAQQAAQWAASRPNRRGEIAEGPEPFSPPSSRDISNSLMALARLGFTPEDGDDDSTAAAGSAATPTAAAAAAMPSQQDAAPASGGSGSLGAAFEGLALATPEQGAPAPEQDAAAASTQLTLPVPAIRALVEYLLAVAATAKTLDLQETATALKQLGLRDLHAQVAAAIVAHHASAAHPGGPGGLAYVHHMGGQPGGGYGLMRGHQLQGGARGQLAGVMPQRRLPQPGGLHHMGWAPAYGQPPGGDAGLQHASGGGPVLAGVQQFAGGHMRPMGAGLQAHLLSLPHGARQGGLAGPGGAAYGGSPGSGWEVAGGYGSFAGGQQQQQPPGMLPGLLQQPQAVYMPPGAPGTGGHYFIMPQQQQQQAGGYVLPPGASLATGLVQQAPAPPGIGAAAAPGGSQAAGHFMLVPGSYGGEAAGQAAMWAPAGQQQPPSAGAHNQAQLVQLQAPGQQPSWALGGGFAGAAPGGGGDPSMYQQQHAISAAMLGGAGEYAGMHAAAFAAPVPGQAQLQLYGQDATGAVLMAPAAQQAPAQQQQQQYVIDPNTAGLWNQFQPQ